MQLEQYLGARATAHFAGLSRKCCRSVGIPAWREGRRCRGLAWHWTCAWWVVGTMFTHMTNLFEWQDDAALVLEARFSPFRKHTKLRRKSHSHNAERIERGCGSSALTYAFGSAIAGGERCRMQALWERLAIGPPCKFCWRSHRRLLDVSY